MSRLEAFIAAEPPATPQLPLTHITKVSNAREVFENGELRTTDCPVLKEKLLYFFYGRAEYRSRGQKASDLPGEKPVCFVCKNFDDSDILATFPFDSGAFYLNDGIRDQYFPHIEDVLDLNLGDRLLSIQRLVSKFFGDNAQYLENDPLRANLDPFKDLEAAAYLQLLNSGGMSILDGRSTTPEMVIHAPISLNNVEYLIAPLQMKGSSYFINRCMSFAITPVYYNIKTPLMPREYISVIQEKLYELP